MGTLVGTGTRLFIGEKRAKNGGHRKERSEPSGGLKGERGGGPFVWLRVFAPGIRHFYLPMSLVSANT